jgi:hypothetical protein
MTKTEFVAEVARKASITRAEATRVIDAVFAVTNGVDSEARGGGASKSSKKHIIRLKGKGGRTREITITLDDPGDGSGSIAVELGSAPDEEILDLALKVWENPADAEEFLATPHGLLDGQTPLSAAETEAGAERVREILLALEYGLPV